MIIVVAVIVVIVIIMIIMNKDNEQPIPPPTESTSEKEMTTLPHGETYEISKPIPPPKMDMTTLPYKTQYPTPKALPPITYSTPQVQMTPTFATPTMTTNMTASYHKMSGIDYPGNDIADSCGRYRTMDEIEMACNGDINCRGYTVFNGKPWCLKRVTDVSVARSDHDYYRKK
jgi:hypothetical protein